MEYGNIRPAKELINRKTNSVRKFTMGDFINLSLLTLVALTIIYPFYNSILVSLVPQQVYTRTPFMLFPTVVNLESYRFVFKSSILLRSMFNSTIIMVVGTFYNMALTVLVGYALAKPLPGRRLFRFFIVFTMYFSGGLIPFYILIKDLKMMDKLSCMIIPTGISIMYMLIISNYFATLPGELEESAKMDGANDFTILLKIILPLSLPLLATFTLYYAVDRWNEWYSGMLFIKSVERLPLQTVLRKIIQDTNFAAQSLQPGEVKPVVHAEGVKMASIVVTMFPLMLMYPFLQRYFLTGLTLGAVKG
jgi:putative aldouronate transport system permease protein